MIFFCALISTAAFGLSESTAPNGCNAKAVWSEGYTGQGVSVGVLSVMHCLDSHEAFFDKNPDGTPTGLSHAHYIDPTGDTTDPNEPLSHDTTAAGIVGSRGGFAYPEAVGVAPGVEIYSAKVTQKNPNDPSKRVVPVLESDWLDWFENALDEFRQNNCRIVTTPIQLLDSSDGVTNANGQSQFSLCYDYYAYTYDLIFANAAGNDETAISIFGDSYNGITTAGLITVEPDVYRRIGTASNPGETIDERKKPEVAAPAQDLRVPTATNDTKWEIEGTERGQTSWAAPHTAGVAALLVNYANTTNSPLYANDGRSEVIKAVIVNSTFPNVQNEYGTSTTGQLWDVYRGYGRIDAFRAYETLKQPPVTPGVYVTASKGWAFQTMTSNYQEDIYRIQGFKNERLIVTVTWHRAARKISGFYYDELPTKFNIDLTITSPLGGEPFKETETKNNLQKVDILLTEDGFYEVTLKNTTTKDRSYAIAFELLPPLEADFNINYIVDVNDIAEFIPYWLEMNCTSEPCIDYDLHSDNQIDLRDYSKLAQKWLTYDPRYYSP